jgi:hypothetical protein
MRHFAGAFVCALFVLGLGREAAHAQSSAPTTASKFETEPFSGAELLRGKRITQAECAALPGAVWAAVDQQGECIRYYHSTAGGSRSEVVVFFSIEASLDQCSRGGQALRFLRQADLGRDAGANRGMVARSQNAVSLSGSARQLRLFGRVRQTANPRRNRSYLRGARRDQIPSWLHTPASRRI